MHRTLAPAIAAATVVALLSTATFVAAGSNGLPDCGTEPREEEAGKDIDRPVDAHVFLNLVDDDPTKIGVWENANLLRGLQTEEWSCEDRFTGEVRTYPADEALATATTMVGA